MCTWQLLLHPKNKKRTSLNGKKKKKKRPLLKFGACKITFFFFSLEANKKNLLQRPKNTQPLQDQGT
jgi:hypothetical protein